MTSGLSAPSEQSGASGFFSQPATSPRRASRMNPSILPPSMSRIASRCSCGPAVFRSSVSWYGWTQTLVLGSGEQTVNLPSRRGIPSAPGYVPK